MKRLLALAVLLSLSLSVNAGNFMSGNELLQACDNASDDCYVYIQGVVDSHETLFEWGKSKESYFCLENDVTPSQIALIVVKYMKEQPEKLHHTAASLVLIPLARAFPCTE